MKRLLVCFLVILLAGCSFFKKTDDDVKIDENAKDTGVYKVVFKDDDGTVIDVQEVKKGENAVTPDSKTSDPNGLAGWFGNTEKIAQDTIITANYDGCDDFMLAVNNAKARQGENGVQICVYLKNNPGVLGMSFAVLYDEESMELVNAVNGKDVPEYLSFTSPRSYFNGCKFLWDGVEVEEDKVTDGLYLILSFDVKEDAVKGKHYVTLSVEDNDFVDNSIEAIKPEVICGFVNIY